MNAARDDRAFLYRLSQGCTPFRVPTAPCQLEMIALPPAPDTSLRDWRQCPADFAKLDARTAQLHLLFGGLLTLGFVLASY